MIEQAFLKKKIKICISPYQLKLKNKVSSVLDGTLMCFEFNNKLKGYSDFLPWPLFGEKKLSQQLNDITQGVESKRFLIAKRNAWLDAIARFKKQNLFYGLVIPPSHFLIENLLSFSEQEEILTADYKYIKVKLGPFDLEKQVEKLRELVKCLPKKIKWRLDLNYQNWFLWKEELEFMKDQIDFIEDSYVNFQNISSKDASFFAEDWIPNSRCKIRIVKPSRDSLESVIAGVASGRWKRIVFTHSFDHPLGQAASIFWASKFYQIHPSFFETSALKCFAFEENNFYFDQVKTPHCGVPSGFGFGFDRYLQAEDWQRLV